MIDEKRLLDELTKCKDLGRKSFESVLRVINEQPKVGEWIPCEVDMPKERDSIFKKFKGTDKWSGGMFETISDIVQVTYEFETGERIVGISNTLDGKWKKEPTYKGKRIIAWKPLDEPYKGE